jgi:hypothetical protein
VRHNNDTGVFGLKKGATLTDQWWARSQGDCSSGFADALATVRSRSGAVTVTATNQGLPVSIKISDDEMRCDMAGLAREITALCHSAAMVSGIRLRAQLLEEGVDADVVGAMGLPTPDDLAELERSVDDIR